MRTHHLTLTIVAASATVLAALPTPGQSPALRPTAGPGAFAPVDGATL
jgi:hypothetical protein